MRQLGQRPPSPLMGSVPAARRVSSFTTTTRRLHRSHDAGSGYRLAGARGPGVRGSERRRATVAKGGPGGLVQPGAEAAAGANQPLAGRCRGDPQEGGGLVGAEAVPGDQGEQLPVIGGQADEGVANGDGLIGRWGRFAEAMLEVGTEWSSSGCVACSRSSRPHQQDRPRLRTELRAACLAIICWRWHAKALPDRAGQRLRWDGSAGGLGLMLVDALHHAALHMQGVVEQVALAVGGVLDQLGEQRLLAGRLTRAD